MFEVCRYRKPRNVFSSVTGNGKKFARFAALRTIARHMVKQLKHALGADDHKSPSAHAARSIDKRRRQDETLRGSAARKMMRSSLDAPHTPKSARGANKENTDSPSLLANIGTGLFDATRYVYQNIVGSTEDSCHDDVTAEAPSPKMASATPQRMGIMRFPAPSTPIGAEYEPSVTKSCSERSKSARR